MTLQALTKWLQELTRMEVLTAGKLIASVAIKRFYGNVAEGKPGARAEAPAEPKGKTMD